MINGAGAIAVLTYYATHTSSGPGKPAVLVTIILYCLGVFTALFAGLYVRRTTQEWSSFWELKSYPDLAERETSAKDIGGRRSGVSAGRRGCSYLLKSSFWPQVYAWQCPWDSRVIRA
jgi:hypothetical protein